jgi:hypothetical protein
MHHETTQINDGCKKRLAGPRTEVPATQSLTNPARHNDSRTLDTHLSVATADRCPIAPPTGHRHTITASDPPCASRAGDGHAPPISGVSSPSRTPDTHLSVAASEWCPIAPPTGHRHTITASDPPSASRAGDGHAPPVSGVSSPSPQGHRLAHAASDPPRPSLAGAGHAPSSPADQLGHVPYSQHACLTDSSPDADDTLSSEKDAAPAPARSRDHPSELIPIYNAVKGTGVPNFLHARIPLPHALNIEAWRRYLPDNSSLCDFLAFGFPTSYSAPHLPLPVSTHHNSALHNAHHVDYYIRTELSHKALDGPFHSKPFPWLQTSPLMTREKKNSTHRRVIINLSAPKDRSVNAGIPQDHYMGIPFKLSLPTANSLAARILEHGRGCHLWSHDLSRGYRQLRTDPLDWPLLGIRWRGSYYFDCAIPFGLRFGAKCMHETTTAVTDILAREGLSMLCYIDDIAGVHADESAARQGFLRTRRLLRELGLQEAEEKATAPSTTMTWLGVHFDTELMTMSVPQSKITECLRLTDSWARKTSCSQSQLRSLLGKLFHISQCCHTLRLFVNRLLDTLRNAPDHGNIVIDSDAHEDLAWIKAFLPDYNGVQLIKQPLSLDIPLVVDSCLTGGGAHFGQLAYHAEYPAVVMDKSYHISQLEMINTMAAIRLWAPHMAGHTVLVKCDNQAAVSVLQTGKGRDKVLLQCARIVWGLTAKFDFRIHVQHIATADNQLADDLSRYHVHWSHRARIDRLVAAHAITLLSLPDNIFSLNEHVSLFQEGAVSCARYFKQQHRDANSPSGPVQQRIIERK